MNSQPTKSLWIAAHIFLIWLCFKKNKGYCWLFGPYFQRLGIELLRSLDCRWMHLSLVFTDSALWAGSIMESPCPCICVSVFLCHRCSFFGEFFFTSPQIWGGVCVCVERVGWVSCVMCHVLYVTCHMSRVTCHVSHVTCHVSCVTCHILFNFLPPSQKKLSVLLSASVKRFSVSRMRDFFF